MSLAAIRNHFFIFGLSGAGKTTFIQAIQKELSFTVPKFTVTRAVRPDDDPQAFEYVTKEAFLKFREEGAFYMEDDDGVNFYGFRRANLLPSAGHLFYGLPAKIDAIRQQGAKCILLQANGSTGLALRNDPPAHQENRVQSNVTLLERYYANPQFLHKIDLILSHRFQGVEEIVVTFRRFAILHALEQRALLGDAASLNLVLKVHRYPLEGMRPNLSFWIGIAFKNEQLMKNFTSRFLTIQKNP